MKTLYKPFALLSLLLFGLLQMNAQPLPYQSAHCQDFFMSVEKGLIKNVEQCLYRNPSLIHKTNNKGYTPLMLACAYGQTDIVHLLIKHKANVNVGNKEQLYPIHLATLSGNEKTVKLLYKHKSDLAVLTKNKQSVVDYAAMTGNKKLLDYYGRKQKKLLDDKDLMLAAAQGGNLQLFKQLKTKGYNIYYKDENQNGVLHYAAQGGNIAMCKYLIDYYEFNIREENKDGKYPMEEALEKGNLEVVKYFFSVGIGMNETNKKGQYWIEVAETYGWLHIISFLEKQNQVLHQLNAFGEDIL